MRDEMDRGARREAYGRMKLLDKAGNEVLTGKKSEGEAPQKPTIMEEMIAMNTVELTDIKGDSRKNTNKYEDDGSSCAGSQNSADTGKGPSRAMGAKRAKTCPDAGNGILRSIDERKAQTSAKVEGRRFGRSETENPGKIGNENGDK